MTAMGKSARLALMNRKIPTAEPRSPAQTRPSREGGYRAPASTAGPPAGAGRVRHARSLSGQDRRAAAWPLVDLHCDPLQRPSSEWSGVRARTRERGRWDRGRHGPDRPSADGISGVCGTGLGHRNNTSRESVLGVHRTGAIPTRVLFDASGRVTTVYTDRCGRVRSCYEVWKKTVTWSVPSPLTTELLTDPVRVGGDRCSIVARFSTRSEKLRVTAALTCRGDLLQIEAGLAAQLPHQALANDRHDLAHKKSVESRAAAALSQPSAPSLRAFAGPTPQNVLRWDPGHLMVVYDRVGPVVARKSSVQP